MGSVPLEVAVKFPFVSVVAVAAVALIVPQAPALAVPPDNDNRANAIVVDPPRTLTGTLVDATLEPTNDYSYCSGTDASVWYRFTAPRRGAIIVQMDAAGDLDGTVDVFKRVRSRLEFLDCAATDSRGLATIDNDSLEPGAQYLIRIGKEVGSVADRFRLRVLIPAQPPQPPGTRLPRNGVRNQVDRLVDPGDAYWAKLRAGRTMRVNLGSDFCTSLTIFAPGTKSFTDDPISRRPCGGYKLFTPDEDGRYVFLVEAGRSRDVQKYRLQVKRAGRDDTVPGIFIRNHARVSGKVDGGIDSRDLYRFDVTYRSQLALDVTGGPSLRLRTSTGRSLESGPAIERIVKAGRYFVAVEGSGKYQLTRVSRVVTKAKIRFDGRRRTAVRPGEDVSLALRVRPRVGGNAVLTVWRKDPVSGWQFLRRYSPRVRSGVAKVTFDPPSVGRYRAQGEFVRNRNSAASVSGFAKLSVRGPLVD